MSKSTSRTANVKDMKNPYACLSSCRLPSLRRSSSPDRYVSRHWSFENLQVAAHHNRDSCLETRVSKTCHGGIELSILYKVYFVIFQQVIFNSFALHTKCIIQRIVKILQKAFQQAQTRNLIVLLEMQMRLEANIAVSIQVSKEFCIAGRLVDNRGR